LSAILYNKRPSCDVDVATIALGYWLVIALVHTADCLSAIVSTHPIKDNGISGIYSYIARISLFPVYTGIQLSAIRYKKRASFDVDVATIAPSTDSGTQVSAIGQ
jgi:hypothetical protein